MKLFTLAILWGIVVWAQSWTTVSLEPYPESCCSTEWDTSICSNTLQQAVNNADEYTTIVLQPGTYCNTKWSSSKSEPADYKHGNVLSINNKKNLSIHGLSQWNKSKLKMDGWNGIKINNCENISVKNLEIEGPALSISGEEATANRVRLTGRGEGGCGESQDMNSCSSRSGCKWSHGLEYCIGETLSYYVGQGIQIDNSDNVTIENNKVHHTNGSGIRADRSDNITITNNVVYGTTWWTCSAPSALVFAEATGTGTNTVTSNVVYGNRNFMPFFKEQMPKNGGNGLPNYGQWNQGSIWDGSGIYLTRCNDYQGTFNLEENVAYDNGINGMVVHKVIHPDATINVRNNKIFDNGSTTTCIEGRQQAGGLTINSGGNATSNVLLEGNKVFGADDDVSYQCFGGTCNLVEGSQNNIACGGEPNAQYSSDAFKFINNSRVCSAWDKRNLNFRGRTGQYPDAQMPEGPQYTPFLENIPAECLEAEPEPEFYCNHNANFINQGPRYNQIDLTDGCGTGDCAGNPVYGEPNNNDNAIAYCKEQ